MEKSSSKAKGKAKVEASASKGPIESDQEVGLNQVNPWMNVKPDCSKHSGSDWYRIILSASLGGRIIHGVNTAPSMEVLGKSPLVPDETTSSGFIRWDPTTFDETSLGNRISDQFYTHHHYRGGQTKSGALLAFDEGSWEPSLRGRARSSSLLAAGLIAHGVTKADALETVSKITSDEVDPEAVEATLLPTSHLKREMVTVSKASHRVFSQGTLQRGIVWDDSRLNLSKHLPHVAYDWGRITAIARYIAEANVQVCPLFRERSLGMGMPFHVVRNAWAEVSTEDYKLPPELFKNVRKLDLAALNVPSIKGAYKDHDEEVFVALTRYLSNEPGHPVSDVYRGHVYLLRSSESVVHRKKKVRTAAANEILEDPETVHFMTDRNIKKQLESICSSKALLAAAIKTRKMNDNTFKRAVENYTDHPDAAGPKAIENLTRMVFDQATWVLANAAANDAARKVKGQGLHGRAHDLLVIQLGQLKSKLFGVKTHLDAPVMFDETALKRLAEHLPELLQKSGKASALTIIHKSDLMTPAMKQVQTVFTGEDPMTQSILEDIQVNAAKEYKRAALIILKYQTQDAKDLGAAHYFTYTALKSLGLRLAMARASGYIDGSAPKETYIYKAAKNLANKHGFGKPKLRFPNYVTAEKMADDLTLTSSLGYNIRDAVNKTTAVLENVTGDLLGGNKHRVAEDLMEEAMEVVPDSDPLGYDTQAIEDQQNLEILRKMMVDLDEELEEETSDPYQSALDTYPDAETAEKYAKVNGYKSFKHAVEVLGLRAHNDDENNFVMIARGMLAPKAKDKGKEVQVAKKKYHPLR